MKHSKPKNPPIDVFNDLTALKSALHERKMIVIEEYGIRIPSVGNKKILWSRVRDEADMLSWIYQLSEKPWLTPDILREILEAFGKRHGWNLHCAP